MSRIRHMVMAALALCASFAVTACGDDGPSVQSTGNPIGAIADTVTMEGTRALVLAELAYATANPIAQAAVRAGAIKGEDATRARNINRTILAALSAAKGAQSAAVQATETKRAMEAIADLNEIVPPH